jgi:hypothetical protein
MTEFRPNDASEKPTTGHGRIPLWIKVMWVFGVSWILGYILLGLRNGPTSW